jgi:hypothetical protein
MVLPFFPRSIDSGITGPEVAKNLAGEESSALIQIRLATPSLAKLGRIVKTISATANRRFKFQKRSQLFIGVHNETLSVIAMCVCNPDCSPVGIHCCHAAPAPIDFAEIVSDFASVLTASYGTFFQPRRNRPRFSASAEDTFKPEGLT